MRLKILCFWWPFFFFHTHPCRCSGILKAKLWICLPQWWFYRAGYAIKCFIAWWFWGVISHISSLTEIYYFLLLMAVKDVWRNGLQGWPCKPHIQALSTESIGYIFAPTPPPPSFFLSPPFVKLYMLKGIFYHCPCPCSLVVLLLVKEVWDLTHCRCGFVSLVGWCIKKLHKIRGSSFSLIFR